MSDVGCWMSDVGCRMLEVGCWKCDVGFGTRMTRVDEINADLLI